MYDTQKHPHIHPTKLRLMAQTWNRDDDNPKVSAVHRIDDFHLRYATPEQRSERTRKDGILVPNSRRRHQDPLPPYTLKYPIGFPSPEARKLQECSPHLVKAYARSEYVHPDEWPLGWLAWNHSFHVPRSEIRQRRLSHTDILLKLSRHPWHPTKRFAYVAHKDTLEFVRTR